MPPSNGDRFGCLRMSQSHSYPKPTELLDEPYEILAADVLNIYFPMMRRILVCIWPVHVNGRVNSPRETASPTPSESPDRATGDAHTPAHGQSQPSLGQRGGCCTSPRELETADWPRGA